MIDIAGSAMALNSNLVILHSICDVMSTSHRHSRQQSQRHQKLLSHMETFSIQFFYEDFAGNDIFLGLDGAYYYSPSNMHYSPGAPSLDPMTWSTGIHRAVCSYIGVWRSLRHDRRHCICHRYLSLNIEIPKEYRTVALVWLH
ncbi:unnamed protein product [Sphagnum balticum]